MNRMVSVVIPTYNREKVVVRALESVLAQEYPYIEVLICDDHSTDHTKSIIEEMEKHDSRVRFLPGKEGEKGANAARNHGVESARGEYIAFLDSDDVMLKNGIIDRVKILEEHPEIDMVYGNVMVNDLCAVYDKIQEFDQHKYLMEELSLCCTIVMMVRKSAFRDGVTWDLKLKSWQDDGLVLALDKCGKKMFHCGKTIAQIEQGNEQISTNYKNLYEGVKRIVKIYRADICKEKSIFRVFLWQLRIWRNWACYKWKGGAKSGLWFYHVVFIVCDVICTRYFRHIWG